jgi:hypothetical protein
MAKKFEELRATMRPERRKRNTEATDKLLAELPLQELRNARNLTKSSSLRQWV